MRNLKYLSFGIIGLIFASCVDEKNLYSPNEEEPEETESGLVADFLLKMKKSISVTAVNGDGKVQKGVKIGIFASQPYGAEGRMVAEPAGVGYTDASGRLNTDVVIANNLSRIYVVPLTAGYGQMQEADVRNLTSLNFHGTAFPYSSAVTRVAADGKLPEVSGPVSNLYQLFVPYRDAEVNEDGIPLQGGSPLVSKEQLSPALINKIDSWYPEKQNVQKADLSKNSDLRIVDGGGAQVWVTYVGDGGFYVANQTIYNSLMYYNYKEGELTGHDDTGNLHMTMLLPNTNQLQCPSGLKIQLLYWNGSEYSKTFPEGTRIGFAVARAGFKKDEAKNITDKTAYNFKNKAYPAVNGDVSGMYYSTPILNAWGKSQAVTRELEGYNCCVTGFDIRPFGDRQSDYDFNDVMVKVTATPERAIEPGEDIPVDKEVTVAESIHGTLAFEDQWPKAGDYDLNDFVVNYTYSIYKNEENQIAGIQMRLKPIAKGAADYTKIGFGIELPLAPDEIDVAGITNAVFESGHQKATFVVWEDANRLFPGDAAGFINTEKGTVPVTAEETVVNIPLKAAVNNISMMRFNPFIFVNKRSHEIHLADFAPTSKMDVSLFGQKEDCSDMSRGMYFRMKDMSCWALDFPRSSSDEAAWRYPKEKSSVVKAYKNYSKWVVDKTDLSWFDSTISGNVDENELY
jgi:hypothetical protein